MGLVTSLGTFRILKQIDGKQQPLVIAGNSEIFVDIPEFFIWSGAMWRITDTDQLRKDFEKKCSDLNMPTVMFDDCIKRCESRGLISIAEGDWHANTLKSLIGNLEIVPLFDSLTQKVVLFLKMAASGSLSIQRIKNLFMRPKLTNKQKAILDEMIKLERPTNLAELAVIQSQSCDYHDQEDRILEEVVNLYLMKLISFDKII